MALDLTLQASRSPQIFYPPPSLRRGTSKLYRPTNGTTGGTGLTQCQLLPSDAPFTGGFITVYNQTYNPMRIDAACVAPTEIANDGYSPIQGGVAGAWTQCTAGQIGGMWTVPPGYWDYTAVNTNTGNAIPAVFVPGFVKIPFTVTSFARTDTPTAPHLLMFRIHAIDAQNATGVAPVQLTSQSTVYSGRRPWNGFYKSGNFAASNQTGIGTPTQQFIPSLSVDFLTSVTTKTVAECGDSTTQGATSTDGSGHLHDYNGALMIACDALSTLTRPVYAANCGFQGLTTTQFMAEADMWINSISPNILVMQPWSINDQGLTENLAEARFLEARNIMLKAKRSGIIPIWRTAIPSGSTSTYTDGVRQQINTYCKTDALFPCIDFDAVVTNGATPARIASSFDSGDATHPNNAGYSAIGTGPYQTMLSNYV